MSPAIFGRSPFSRAVLAFSGTFRSKRVARIAILRLRSIRFAGHLCGVECNRRCIARVIKRVARPIGVNARTHSLVSAHLGIESEKIDLVFLSAASVAAFPGTLRAAGQCRGCLGREDRNDGRPPARSVFRCVKTFGTKRVRDIGLQGFVMAAIRLRQERMSNKGLALEVHPAHRATMSVYRSGNIDRPRLVIAAKGFGDQSTIEIEVGAESATACRAARNCGGSSLPRFSARRRIPAHAFGLK